MTASNAGGSASATSGSVNVPAPPGLLGTPSIDGVAAPGYVLTCNPGTWSNGPTFAYRWLRCNRLGNSCVLLAADGTTYRLGQADVGNTLRVRVTASNADGRTAARSEQSDVVVDLCCGSAAFGAVLARRWPRAEVHAADADPAAVVCARRNLPPERVHEGDLYAALPDDLRGRVDLVVANAPYVPTGEIATMPRDARDHEHGKSSQQSHD